MHDVICYVSNAMSVGWHDVYTGCCRDGMDDDSAGVMLSVYRDR